jgi:hypothetical protein
MLLNPPIGIYNLMNPSIENILIDANKEINAGKLANGVTMIQGIKASKDSQWRIIKMLSVGIQDKSIAPYPLNIKSDSIKEVLPEVISALGIIKGIKLKNDEVYKEANQVIDLRKTDLNNVDFVKAKLQRTSFDKSYLYRTDLSFADLSGAFLRGTYLRAGSLNGANLKDARLDSITHGKKIDKSGHDVVIRTDLIQVGLVNTNLDNANLKGVKFFDTDLKGSKLKEAKLAAVNNITQACNWHLAKYSAEMSNLLVRKANSKKTYDSPGCKDFGTTKK